MIKDGFVIDHMDSNSQNNSLSNLQTISQSKNLKRGGTGKYSRRPKSINSFDLENNDEKIFQSMNAPSIYFDICRSSIRFVAEGIQKLAISKKNGHIKRFSYMKVA